MACELTNKVWVYGKMVGFNSGSSRKHVFISFWKQTAPSTFAHPLGMLSLPEAGLSHMGRAGFLPPFLSSHSCALTHRSWVCTPPLITVFHHRTLPAGGDFWASVCGPRHKEMHTAFLIESWDYSCKGWKTNMPTTHRLSGVLFKSESAQEVERGSAGLDFASWLFGIFHVPKSSEFQSVSDLVTDCSNNTLIYEEREREQVQGATHLGDLMLHSEPSLH